MTNKMGTSATRDTYVCEVRISLTGWESSGKVR